MREVSVKLYRFDELPQEVQKKIWEGDQNRYNYAADSYYWEFRKTLDTFAELFGVCVRWEVDSSHYNFDFTISDTETAENLETIRDPLRLATWVYNNHWWHIRKGKYYSTPGKWVNGEYKYKYRHSRVIFSYDDCPLTGVFCDLDILRAVIDCITYRRAFDTFDDLITTALNEFFETWRDALAYAESFEFYAEEAAAQEWEYTADGSRWRG